MKMYHVRDMIPSSIMESSLPKTKLGYAKHLMECISRRSFLEGSAEAGDTLNRIADKTIGELNKKGAIDPSAFGALIVFGDKINTILEQLTKQYHAETDPEAKQKLAKQIMSSRFLSNPSQDAILKKALQASKSSTGNRLANFIMYIIKEVLDKKTGTPIDDFKKEVTNLRKAIEKFFYEDFPYKATIKAYKESLLGTNSVTDIMEQIADSLVNHAPQISKLNSSITHGNANPNGFKENMPVGKMPELVDHHMSYAFESQEVFMEAFAESLGYFSRNQP